MKFKLLGFALLFSACFTSSFAQDTKIGLKAGLNMATLGGDIEGVKLKPGLHIGAFASFPLSDMIHIQPELVFSQQGAASKDNSDIKNNLNYLNLPVMVKIYPIEKVNIQVGPQIGYLLSAKAKYGDEKMDMKDDVNAIDFSLGFGVGVEPTENLGINFRYNLGLSNIAKDSGDESLKNNVLQLGVSYAF